MDDPAPGTLRTFVALAVFALLAVVHTWPLASHPARLSRNDTADALLNTWAIAWVAHQLPRNPQHLFDANIFYPEAHTLAYSEAMLVQGALALPVMAAGGSPVLAYNLVLLAGFTFTGWAFWWLAERWTGSESAAYVTGCLAAFNAHVLVRLPHLQAQHVEFVALALFAIDQLARTARVRHAALLGAAFALQALTSIYAMVFTTWLLTFCVVARSREGWRRHGPRVVALVGLAAVVAAVLLTPYLRGYAEVHRLQGFERAVDDGQRGAASWRDYLATGARLYYPRWRRWFDESRSTSFPGITALLLLGLGGAWPESRRDPRFRMCVVAGLGCLSMSMLPHLPFYDALHRHVLLLRLVRVPAHLGQYVLLMIAVAAGFGMAGVLRRCQSPAGRAALTAAVLLLVNGEALRAPLDYTPFDGISAVYETLAAVPDAVVLELPLYEPAAFFGNAEYMLASTRHWRPMVNGYSGFRPSSYDRLFERLRAADLPTAVSILKAAGVTHVVVHTDRMGTDEIDDALRTGLVRPFARDQAIRIVRLQ